MSVVAQKSQGEVHLPSFQAQAHEITRRQVQQWFDWMDGILDIHRANFLFREATPAQLNEHKTTLREAIRYGLLFHSIIADADYNEPELVSRLQTRIRKLQDAYDTFHDATFSDAEAEEALKQVFPE